MTTTTTEPAVRELSSLPGTLGLYARAVRPRPRRHAPLAGEGAVQLRGAVPDPERLRAYREVCGYAAGGDRLPAAFPHLTAFPLSMALMTARDFPLPVLGLVHLANRVEQVRPITPDESLDHLVRSTAPRQHSKGRVFEIVAEARAAGSADVVWRSVSTYLHRGPGGGAAPRTVEEDLPPALLEETWPLAPDLGRRYGAVSGDRNPIHLHPLAARLFGFRRAIAHGMWSKARALAALEQAEGGLPDAFTVGVDFRRPVLLPGSVRFAAARIGGNGWAFHVTDPSGAQRHLLGRLNPH
ncbi:acyl dehydratase [Streptacidiphilus sp. MAP12-33]|uniref:MaoC/PaaZ C-terminal domain-containing protein n=1 Tax=Streptacidiphilus sp. MAP12-33 TaxID=3156266 RepID=UPI003515A459